MVILEHNLGNSQVSVYRTIGPTLVNSILFIIVAFVLLIEVEATINVPFSCHVIFKTFTIFLRVIKGRRE